MSWLVDPASTDVGNVIAQGHWLACPPPYSAETVRQTSRGENGDPLDEVPDTMARFRIYPQMGFRKAPAALLLRREVIRRLSAAEKFLPAGLRFVVLDGWRPLKFQEELVSYYSQTMYPEVRDQYVSNPDNSLVAPPHVTGGAVDITLEYSGKPLAMGTDYDAFDKKADLDWYEQFRDDELEQDELLIRALRRCLSDVLCRCGFAQYPREWWHWSYGDQWWAARYGHTTSLYSEIF